MLYWNKFCIQEISHYINFRNIYSYFWSLEISVYSIKWRLEHFISFKMCTFQFVQKVGLVLATLFSYNNKSNFVLLEFTNSYLSVQCYTFLLLILIFFYISKVVFTWEYNIMTMPLICYLNIFLLFGSFEYLWILVWRRSNSLIEWFRIFELAETSVTESDKYRFSIDICIILPV